MKTTTTHPYNPPSLILPFDYAAPTVPLTTLLGTIAAVPIITTSLTLFILSQTRPNASLGVKARTTWFTICLTTHLLLEAPLILSTPTRFFAQPYSHPASLWLEYSLSDSRYLNPPAHPVLYLTELLTIFLIAPFDLLALIGTLSNSLPTELAGTVVTSGMYLFSVSLYFLDAVLNEGGGVWEYCRDEAWYRWFYFVCMNAVWGVVPLIWLTWAWRTVKGLEVENGVLRRMSGPVPEIRRESVGGTKTVLVGGSGSGVRRSGRGKA
ncbi:hypothetical protein BJ508DRAFT_358517 [Ascobolus immersus RN42]|uniref:EXPERA domain-containing protein n=1 Tax=Ascobolus immersus RN42 TaxID=1160509 RepID=A0A3N4IIJ9_ASCIM|nr:hypothetical protein BJ508DRAFT_358517 [Ascobolus immersus RN42]